ncbi:unnamed protein product [Oikopleura dioica]|uniref:Uncharacterized protein n=1 Tax=Oikopleura dioica TaxID=34765 RepID=E4Z4F0_OIKDI|nr:unnamed protein product [Oikopleura dioica]
METESEAEMTPQRNTPKAASKKEEKENIGRSSTRIKTMNLDSSEASEKEDTPKRGRRTRLEEKKMDDSNVTVNRRKRKPASSQSSQESDTGSVSSRRSSSRISSQKTESPKKVKAPTKKQKTVAKSGTRRSIRK